MLRKAKKELFLTFFEKKVRPKNLNFYHTVFYLSMLIKILKFFESLKTFLQKSFQEAIVSLFCVT